MTTDVTTPSLDEVIAEVEKDIRDKARRYPEMVASVDRNGRPRLLQATADHKLACMRAAQSWLVWLAANRPWIAAAHAHLKTGREIDDLTVTPEVAAVLSAFPGSFISASRPLSHTPHTEDYLE